MRRLIIMALRILGPILITKLLRRKKKKPALPNEAEDEGAG